jgi:rRNA small subunit pseudouridine methyltransferase Nep1
MLTMILAEAELERIPEELYRHPAVLAHARQRGKKPQQILLDSNYDHAAMTNLPEGRRRGRPDLTHLFLLTVLESRANKQGLLRVLIHTRDDVLITVSPQTRIMRNYDRFQGLIEQLFEKHAVPDEKHPLLQLTEHVPLQQLVNEQPADAVLVFSKDGKPVVLPEYFDVLRKKKKTDILCIIGGFPSGDFHADIKAVATDVLSVYPEMLSAWAVASEVVVTYGYMHR